MSNLQDALSKIIRLFDFFGLRLRAFFLICLLRNICKYIFLEESKSNLQDIGNTSEFKKVFI